MSGTQAGLFETDADARRVPAAMYVRMSTEHQQYSTANQAEAIRQYADRHGLRIVETFADEGRSGLQLSGRESLKRLLDVVTGGTAAFRAILVYDVSRWGRFQDTDESAYYEFQCRRSRIEVHYCAEPFANDGGPLSSLMKAIKRTMAGEYSRELSAKVFRGQCRLVRMGYWQGGTAGFGLRRMLVDPDGRPRCVLGLHERKSLQTDRVVLVPGPEAEVEVVRWMYRAILDDGLNETEIMRVLNTRGIRTDRGLTWSLRSVRRVLTCERYIGNYVYHRQSERLAQRRRDNPPADWVRCDGLLAPLVDPDLFHRVQDALATRARRSSRPDPLIPGLLPGTEPPPEE